MINVLKLKCIQKMVMTLPTQTIINIITYIVYHLILIIIIVHGIFTE